ncbi:unnamed protein product [Rhodiola kirilowii]
MEERPPRPPNPKPPILPPNPIIPQPNHVAPLPQAHKALKDFAAPNAYGY